MKPNLAEFTEQFGLILFVEKFHECEKFYAETIGLRILYRKESLTAFEFGFHKVAERLPPVTNHLSPLTHTSHFSPITSYHSTRFPLAHGRLLTLLLHRSEGQSANQLLLRKPSHDHDWGDG